MSMTNAIDVTVVGGGMITRQQLLPSLYHLQRAGAIADISICALSAGPLQRLAQDNLLNEAFPGQSFNPYPDFNRVAGSVEYPELYLEVIAGMRPRQIVVVALPDHMHYPAIVHALRHFQHVICVKPLVMRHAQAQRIEKLAYARGLFVGTDYHKRFDFRLSLARRKYRSGDFGEFRLGTATLIEPWYYRHSNFQNWCTVENSDMFSYIGCHYVDQVHLITGLLPVEVSVYGIEEHYPNGRSGYLWTNARVVWENGAALSVLNGMGYPDAGPGGNSQGLWLFTQGERDGGVLFHDDQYRGVRHSFVKTGDLPGESLYNEPNPDYFMLLQRGGKGLAPAGYGYRSIESLVAAVGRVEAAGSPHNTAQALNKRREVIKGIDVEGMLATPANSAYNELVIEAGRKSILSRGREVAIEYGAKPRVRFKTYRHPS